MSRTFNHDVSIELLFNSMYDNVKIMATVDFTATPIVPGSWNGPANGGEVEALKVIDLFIPEIKAKTGTAVATPRRTLECPQWLAEMIVANVDEDELFQSADFSDDQEYERD